MVLYTTECWTHSLPLPHSWITTTSKAPWQLPHQTSSKASNQSSHAPSTKNSTALMPSMHTHTHTTPIIFCRTHNSQILSTLSDNICVPFSVYVWSIYFQFDTMSFRLYRCIRRLCVISITTLLYFPQRVNLVILFAIFSSMVIFALVNVVGFFHEDFLPAIVVLLSIMISVFSPSGGY